jgi:uncharacterized protein
MALHIYLLQALSMAVSAVKLAEQESVSEPVIAASVDDLELKSSPINADWILSGNPQARIAEHSQSADDAAITALWDCTAGSFRWYFGWDETVMILEGEVHVTDEAGSTRTLRAGDIAYFAGKTWATWRVDNYVKKIAFVRKPFPAPVVLAVKLKAMFSRMKAGANAAEPLRSGL